MVNRNRTPARLPWTNSNCNSMRGYAHPHGAQALSHRQQQHWQRVPFGVLQHAGPVHKAQMMVGSHVHLGVGRDVGSARTFFSMQPGPPPRHSLARAGPAAPHMVHATRFKRRVFTRSSRRSRKQQQNRRREAVKAAQVQQQVAAPQSPVCPPAPFNSNSYLMQYHATAWQPPVNPFDAPAAADSTLNNFPASSASPPQQTSGVSYHDLYKPQQQQAPTASVGYSPAAGAAVSPAVLEAEVAEWDPLLQEVTTFQRSSAARASRSPSTSATTDAPASPVCPPAPLVTNEFYAARFEQQQEAAGKTAAAAARPFVLLLQAEVVEWDPLLKEVTTLQRSTAHSQPASCIPADDTCSQC